MEDSSQKAPRIIFGAAKIVIAVLLIFGVGIAWSIAGLPGSPAIGRAPTQGREGVTYILTSVGIASIITVAIAICQFMFGTRQTKIGSSMANILLLVASASFLSILCATFFSQAGFTMTLSSFHEDSASSAIFIERATDLLGSSIDDRGAPPAIYRIYGFGITVFGKAVPSGREYVSNGRTFNYEAHQPLYEEYGWPFRCVRAPSFMNFPRGSGFRLDRFVKTDFPILIVNARLLPAPFSANIMFFSLILWEAIVIPGQARRAWRAWAGRCLNCGYPVGQSAVCTECGAPHKSATGKA